MIKNLPWSDRPAERAPNRPLRLLAALLLRAASAALARAARRLAQAEKRPPATVQAVVLEFYAEAGAPEGALYADGVLVGYLPDVKRL